MPLEGQAQVEWAAAHQQPWWIELAKRWAICFVVAVGVAWLSVSSVQLAVLVVRTVVWMLGAEIVDGAGLRSC